MFHLSLRILWLTCCLCLAGCGNAYERISMGEWTEVGQPEPPVAGLPGEFIVETRVEGDGPVVKAGDLVKVRISVTTVADNLQRMITPEPHDAWLWVGREPTVEVGREPTFEKGHEAVFGNLGSARVRRALIGRRLHERFEIRLEKGAEGSTDAIPVRGVFEGIFTGRRASFRFGDKEWRVPEWPRIDLVDDWGGTASAKIEIVGVCTAKLFRRTAVLRQWGFVLNMFDSNYRYSRKGTLGWTVIEAQCPAPDGRFRLQAGPFYFDAITQPTKLLTWGKSYTDLRPPRKFPEEWEVVASK